MTKYGKLVRDNIPEIIQSSRQTPVTHIASNNEYDETLVNKLIEEVGEFRVSGETEELADILEVIDAICELRGIDRVSLQQIKQEKAQKRGSFSKRVILDRVK